MSQTITPEIVAPEEAQLALVVRKEALQAETAQSIQVSFAPFFAEARKVINQSRGIVVTDASQKLEIKLAGECRKALKAIRVSADKARKEMKDESLRRGRAIDGFFNILLDVAQTEETRLQAQEDFVAIKEQERKEALKVKRTEIALANGIDPNLYSLGEMAEETFQQLVEGTKLARAAEAERVRKAEAERIAKEAADQAERERVRQELERLKREADENEAALKVERERVAEEQRVAALAAKAELDRREALAAEERRQHEAAAAEIRRIAKEAADRAAKEKAEAEEAARKERAAVEAAAADLRKENERVLAEQKRLADEAAAAERKRVEAERAAEAEIARKEKLRLQALAEVERQKQEAARKVEAERVKKEREELERQANAERSRAERLQEAILHAQAIKAKNETDAAEAARKAAAARDAAPDRIKLLSYASALREVAIPSLIGAAGQAVAKEADDRLFALVQWVEGKAGAL